MSADSERQFLLDGLRKEAVQRSKTASVFAQKNPIFHRADHDLIPDDAIGLPEQIVEEFVSDEEIRAAVLQARSE